jgi:ubiquinone/menaquinone biosynthesis C-methylase UbiE
MNPSNPEYALDRSPREYARLAMQAEFLRPSTRRLFEEAGICAGLRVLDLGSGAGDICILLGEMVGPTGEVIGVDVDADAVDHARRRVAEAGIANVSFQHSDLAHYVAGAPLDAIVGRLVLCYQADPAAVLAALVQQLRPGGIVAFQEPWMMPMGGPDTTGKRLATCILETMRRSGAHLDLGPRLHQVFTGAGLPQPQMRLEAMMDGRDDSPIYQYFADTLSSFLPKAVEYGIATAADFDIDSIPERLRAERSVAGYAVMTPPLISAWCRKPE